MHMIRRGVYFGVSFVILVLGFQVTAQLSIEENLTEEQKLLVALNEWRLEEDLWPLRPNETLRQMAEDQANYILSLSEIPSGSDIHLGRTGEGIRRRARFEAYNWPIYGSDEARISVTEIANVGPNVSTAISWWHSSPTHNRSVTNGAYREVGIVALPHPFGYLYLVVLGGRPNVLPTIYDPGTRLLHLSNENVSDVPGDWVHEVKQVRFFDFEGKPLHEGWLPWALTMPLPDNTGERLFVVYTDAEGTEVLSEVTIGASYEDIEPVVIAAEPTSTPRPTNTPTATTVPEEDAGPAVAPAFATNTPIPTLTPIATPIPAAEPNLILLYHSRILTIKNNSNNPLNVSKLVLTNGDTELPITEWDTEYLDGTLAALPAGDCLQGWSFAESPAGTQTNQCRFTRSLINLYANQMFWAEGDFVVKYDGEEIAQCRVSSPRCAVTIP